jgi:hypothetical protein
MKYLEAWGTLINEKNLKSKISCQTLFKKIEAKRPLLIPDIRMIEAKRTPEKGKILAKKNKRDQSKTNRAQESIPRNLFHHLMP